MKQSERWTRLNRNITLDTKHMKVYQDSVKLPSGLVIKDYSVVSLPSGVVVVATTPEGELIVQSEYKYAIDQTILNLPSGSVELGEAPIEVAQRELFEETGYQAEYFELIRTLYEYPSKATHVIHIVRGVNASKVRGTTHESTEQISNIRAVTADELRSSGESFNATYTIAALSLTLPEFVT